MKTDGQYIESRETNPKHLKAGDKVAAIGGFSTLESVEFTPDGHHFIMTFVPNVYGTRETCECNASNWPFVATGRKTTKDRCHIRQDGSRF